jgi:hypothetical protein
VVGRRGENFGVEKRWKKYIYLGREDGIFVHPENGLNGLIRNWCIGGCWFTPAHRRPSIDGNLLIPWAVPLPWH